MKYSLDIISHHPDFKGKSLKQYDVEGIPTLGAYGSEEFEIRFTNHTAQKLQLKLSLEGTDILSGAKATTEPTDKMWVVNAYSSLCVKAWPESDKGGATFVFTNAGNSVAVHTHGDVSCRGIIAAAVFVEGHVEPIHYEPWIITQPVYPWPWVQPTYPNDWWYVYPWTVIPSTTYPYTGDTWTITNTPITNTTGSSFGSGGSYTSSCLSPVPTAGSGASYTSGYLNVDPVGSNPPVGASQNASEVGVGAGQYANQNIAYVPGLIKPVFSETVRVRFMWWDELKAKLQSQHSPAPHASGFPGDRVSGINLGSTPRVGQPSHRATTPAPVFSRV
jgi:hypothetical protein